MKPKIGDGALVMIDFSSGNGGSGKLWHSGRIVAIVPEGVGIELTCQGHKGERVVVSWEDIFVQAGQAKKSLLQKALRVGKEIVFFPIKAILTIIGLVGLAVFLAGGWLWEKITSLRKRRR